MLHHVHAKLRCVCTAEYHIPCAGSNSERAPSLVVADGGHFRHGRFWRGAGIAIPVFSLRTELSVGVGEFRDMRMLIDFCEAIQFQLVQVLPINDTSVNKMWWDSYPYSSLSVSTFSKYSVINVTADRETQILIRITLLKLQLIHDLMQSTIDRLHAPAHWATGGYVLFYTTKCCLVLNVCDFDSGSFTS